MFRETLIATLALSFLGTATVAQEKMRISLQLPLTSHLGENLTLFEKEVEEQDEANRRIDRVHEL